MLKWLGQRFEKRERQTGELEEREISISPMVKWLTRRFDKKEREIRQLWEREFDIVKKGLDEEQVVSFVNELVAQHSALLDPLLEATVTDAERLAASIRIKAQQEAETEAEMIISQARQEVQEIKRRAEVAAEKETEDILSAANRKAELAEVQAKQRALLFLLRVREEIEKEIGVEYKNAHSRLFSRVQDLISEGQNIEAELRSKRVELWGRKTFELEEYEAELLNIPGTTAPSLEALAPTEAEIEPDTAEEKLEELEESVQSQEEAFAKLDRVMRELRSVEEKVEEPVQLKEEVLEEKVEEPVQLKEEEALEEKVEEPVQLKEEALEEKVEEPVQLREEALEEKEEVESAPLELDSQAAYAGEVELIIASPVELRLVSRLYNHLQTIPDLRILYTRGSWDQGTTIIVVLDKPLPLINLISEMPDVEVTPESLEKESQAAVRSGSLLRGGERGATRIKLVLKEAQPL